jgi:hypothetical protein
VLQRPSGQSTASLPQHEPLAARTEILEAEELQLLADRSLELAERYDRDAEFMDDEEGRQIALALSNWRRQRSRFFRELSAAAERDEATQIAG